MIFDLILGAGVPNSSDKIVAAMFGIYTSPDFGITWVSRPAAPSDAIKVSSSADGVTLIVTLSGSTYVWFSTDSGVTWTSHQFAEYVNCTKVSADGMHFYAGCEDGPIYHSQDFGGTWTTTGSGSNKWYGITCSSNGQKVLATARDTYLMTSTNFGGTWSIGINDGNGYLIGSVSSSDDGVYLFGGGLYGSYSSGDSGVTWNDVPGTPIISGIASSSNGAKLVASANGYQYLNTSTDYGATWTQRNIPTAGVISYVASSADGTKLVAMSGNHNPHVSYDSGVTWIERTTAPSGINWQGVASGA
jgi:hypothetical protein